MIQAVIGIGSNSVRLLVTDTTKHPLPPLLRQREGTRLFANLQQGLLSEEGMRRTADCVARQQQTARKAGATRIFLFATSATRDAENQEAFCAFLRAETGLSPMILTGEEEAQLSYQGIEQPGLCGVLDIGGGSTEWTVGRDGVALSSQSAQMGAVRLAQALPITDDRDIVPAIDAAVHALSPMLPGLQSTPADIPWVGVGGTCITLAAMDLALSDFDESLLEGHPLTEAAVLDWLRKLASLPLQDRRRIPGLPPDRADIIPQGCAILLACMRLLRVPSIHSSNRGNLEGFLLRHG